MHDQSPTGVSRPVVQSSLPAGFRIMAYGEAVRQADDRAQVRDAAVVPSIQPAVSGLSELICSFRFPCEAAIRIFRCESANFRRDIVFGPTVSPTNDRGISQINAVHAGRFTKRGWDYYVDAFVPERNLAVAEEIYLDQGWSPWTCAH